MGTPFMGEIKLISWNYAPKGWALCNGQTLPINQNQALFSLFGTAYGGDGRVNFKLPDFRGKIPIHFGNGHTIGETAGTESVTINQQTMPTHIHFLNANSTNADTPIASGHFFGATANLYVAPGSLTNLQPATVSNFGGSQAHENRQPYLALNFIVALQGIFPSQN